jgi:uncharacterized membrane protein
MTTTEIYGLRRIDEYLARLRHCLRGVDEHTIHEIVEELRSHIVDKAVAGGEVTSPGVDAALESLGRPEDLAREYVTDALLARAEHTRSPIRILSTLFHWAGLSAAGVLVLITTMAGYFLGLAFIGCGLMKLIHPQSAGLWASRSLAGDLSLSLRVGFTRSPATGNDVFGVWTTPLGLVAGFGLVVGTTAFALWCTRRYRRSRPLPKPPIGD